MTRLRSIMLVVAIGIATADGAATSQSTASFIPPNGFVPDAATASRIAEAVWIPIYGEKAIATEKPFKATLRGDVWTVSGKDLPPGATGGVAEADISKRDGRILRVIHGQ
jgi:hypothetical protein